MINERLPWSVQITKIGDMSVQSILDSGFIRDYELTPVIHVHSYYEIHATVEGVLVIESASGQKTAVPQGCVCLIPPTFYHRTLSDKQSDGKPCSKLGIRFLIEPASSDSTDKLYDICRSVLAGCTAPILVQNAGILFESILTIRQECRSNGLAAASCISALLGRLYIELFRSMVKDSSLHFFSGEHGVKKEEKRRLAIDEYFSCYYRNQITEEDLARYIGLSKRQISRILKKDYGKSFREILIDMRMQQAVHLLITTDQSVEAIAAAVGYTSLSGFYYIFQKKLGMTAEEYRRLYASS